MICRLNNLWSWPGNIHLDFPFVCDWYVICEGENRMKLDRTSNLQFFHFLYRIQSDKEIQYRHSWMLTIRYCWKKILFSSAHHPQDKSTRWKIHWIWPKQRKIIDRHSIHEEEKYSLFFSSNYVFFFDELIRSFNWKQKNRGNNEVYIFSYWIWSNLIEWVQMNITLCSFYLNEYHTLISIDG